MKSFYKLLSNNLLAATTTNFVWFALVFFVYLETRSVILSSVIGSVFPLLTSATSVAFGTFVDHHKKKTAMLVSSYLSFASFSLAGVLFWLVDTNTLLQLTNPFFWVFIILLMFGAIAGNLRMITLSTLVTLLVPEKKHDKANGLVGTVNGVSFAITSVFSGLAIANIGMGWSVALAATITLFVILHLWTIHFKDTDKLVGEDHGKKVDFAGAYKAVRKVPGLMGLIYFTMINNFLGGVFFSLMDPYGLELVSVQTWGFIWGGLSFSFILGGMLVAKFGLGKNPLQKMFLANILMWFVGMLFPLQASIMLLIAGMFMYMILVPFVEAAEQTILQKVVPLAKQGRVFGFAQTLETLATPIMSLTIGPLAHFIFIPYMTTGSGVELIGNWFGTGVNRGIGLVFITASFVGLVITVLAFNSKVYKTLVGSYNK